MNLCIGRTEQICCMGERSCAWFSLPSFCKATWVAMDLFVLIIQESSLGLAYRVHHSSLLMHSERIGFHSLKIGWASPMFQELGQTMRTQTWKGQGPLSRNGIFELPNLRLDSLVDNDSEAWRSSSGSHTNQLCDLEQLDPPPLCWASTIFRNNPLHSQGQTLYWVDWKKRK